MKKRFNKALVISTLVCLLPILLGLAMYNQLPEQVATHWGTDGQPNGYSSRWFAVFGLPLFMAVVNLVAQLGVRFDPKGENHPQVMLTIVRWICPVLSVIMSSVVIFTAMGAKIPMDRLTLAVVGVVMIIVGNYLPKCKQNYTIGIKLPWTLNDEDNWNRTHRLGGWMYTLGGMVMIVGGLLGMGWPVFVIFFALAMVPAVYSFALYQKKQKQ